MVNGMSTSISIINEIIESNEPFDKESLKNKYGTSVMEDIRKVYDTILEIPWYGIDFNPNLVLFTADCKRLFPGISEKAISNLHASYAWGWIP